MQQTLNLAVDRQGTAKFAWLVVGPAGYPIGLVLLIRTSLKMSP